MTDRHADPRPARDRHDPDALDRRRPEGELRPSGRPDGRRADGLHALDAVPPPRPDPPGLARPRPLRPERRPRVDAPVLAPPPDRLRRHARGPRELPPVGLADAGPPRVRPDAGRRGDDRAARARASRTPSGWRSPRSASRAEFNRDGHDIVDHWTYTLCSDGDLQEGIASEAAQPRRPPPPAEARRPLRRQPHPARRPDLDGLVGGRRRPVRGLWLARRPASRTATTSRRSRPRSRRPAPTTGRA